MQSFLQQNGPTVTATPHVKPLMHGDSGTRSQSSLFVHVAVHRPFVPLGYMAPFGGVGFVSGTFKHSRVTQSSDGDATTTSLGSGMFVPRSHSRPTGLPLHAPSAQRATTPHTM